MQWAAPHAAEDALPAVHVAGAAVSAVVGAKHAADSAHVADAVHTNRATSAFTFRWSSVIRPMALGSSALADSIRPGSPPGIADEPSEGTDCGNCAPSKVLLARSNGLSL